MDKNRQLKVIAIVALCIAVIGLSVAYAAMSTSLKINGTATMNTASWSIKFANLSEVAKTGTANVVTAPTLSDTHIGDYNVELTKPGDSITYTFDVMNTGTLDAIMSTFTKAAKPTCTGVSTTNATADATIVCNNLSYTLTYTASNEAVKANDTLAAGETKNLTLKLSYDGNELPSDDVNVSGLDITMIYEQQ